MKVALKRIHLFNYRSCINTSFSLEPDLSVLIGPNGSGKTNILSGLVLLRRLLDERHLRHFEREAATGECVLKAWFEVDGNSAILTAKVSLNSDQSNDDVVVTSAQSWYMKDFTGSAKRLAVHLGAAYEMSSAPHGTGLWRQRSMYAFARVLGGDSPTDLLVDKNAKLALEAIGGIASWVRGITYYAASQFTNPSACPVSIEVESSGAAVRRARRHEGTAARFLSDLYSAHQSKSEGYRAFVDIIGPRGIHLIDGLSFKELKTSSVDYAIKVGGQAKERRVEKIIVVPQFAIGKNALSPNQLSEGTFKTIALLFYLLTETRTLLLLEEPEVCVHHGLLASILELMRTASAGQQIVVSTHSDLVLDHVEPRSVFAVVRSKDGETSISSITKSMSTRGLVALRQYLETEGTLGEYWKHGALN